MLNLDFLKSDNLIEFYIEGTVDNSVGALSNLFLEFEPGVALALLDFELLLLLNSFLI